MAALAVGLVWLAHTTLVDRLEITKLAVALLVTAGATLWVGRRAPGEAQDGVREPLSGAPVLGWLGVCLLAASLLFGDFLGARVEGWAPLVAAGLVVGLVRRGPAAAVGGPLALAAGLLALLGLAQALGWDWPSANVSGFRGRPVMGTLGNPDLYGVCLAGALPFALVRARRTGFAVLTVLIVAAVVVSGSRTAWVMLIPAVMVGFWCGPRWRVAALWASGSVVAVVVALGGGRVGLGERLADLGESGGTAAGRLYLWRVNWDLLVEAGPLGGGPQAFQRRWPAAQGAYLAAHPEEAGFYSDLRHAHADPVEVAVDWGWLGLALGGWWVVRLLRPRGRRVGAGEGGVAELDAGEAGLSAPSGAWADEQAAARGSLVALLLGGLAFPVLFQTPSLLLVAVSAGVLTPQTRGWPTSPPPRWSRWGWRLAAVMGVLLTLFWAGQRAVSELLRTEGLRAEVVGRLELARERYERAAAVDPRNPLAQWMVARSQLTVDPAGALGAAERAVRELPTAPVYALRAAAAEAAGEAVLAAESWAMVEALYPSRASN